MTLKITPELLKHIAENSPLLRASNQVWDEWQASLPDGHPEKLVKGEKKMKLYKITKPYHAIDSRYDGEQVLCSNPDNEQEFKFLPWFSARNEAYYASIDDCRTRIAAINDIKPGAVFITIVVDSKYTDKYDVWTVDSEPRTTIDGSETYHNALTWLANIEEV